MSLQQLRGRPCNSATWHGHMMFDVDGDDLDPEMGYLCSGKLHIMGTMPLKSRLPPLF